MASLLSARPISQDTGLFITRLITGLLLIYHAWEIFDGDKMNEYQQWDMFKKSSSGATLVYAGKALELAGGILLTLGLFTRLAALMIIGTLGYIAFFIGHGKVWYEDQHPFLFVLLALVFFFMGAGSISMDALLSKSKTNLSTHSKL